MKKTLCAAVAAVFLAFSAIGIFSGCAEKPLGFVEGHKYPETLKVEMISSSIVGDNGQEIGDAGSDAVVKFLEEKFNVKFEFLYTPSPTQEEVYNKINMMAVTGDLPDIITAGKDKRISMNVYESLIENGTIVNAKEYVNEDPQRYPVLSELLNSPEVNTQEFCYKNGELYMIPRYFGKIDHGFIIRKDWIDAYNGGVVPKTYKELEQLLVNFQNARPGGVEQIGLSLPSSWWLNHIYSGFVGGNTWVKNDSGIYEYAMLSDGQKEALTWLKGLYGKNLLDKESISNAGGEKETVAKFVSGRCGAFMMGTSYARQLLREQGWDDDIELIYTSIDGSRGPMLNYMTDYFEGCVINKSFKDLPRLFDFIEYLLSDEGDMLMRYGIEGVHYTKGGDKIVVNTQKRKEEGWASGRHPISKMFNIEVQSMIDESYCADYEALNAYIDSLDVEVARWVNPFAGIVTDAEKEVGSKPFDTIGTYTLKFITGGFSLDTQWKEFTDTVKKEGIDAIAEEINGLAA